MASQALLSVTKAIIRKAAEIGLDEAGTRLCGSLWPSVKKMLSPVVEELERRFPKLMLVGSDEAKAAATQAENMLTYDPGLQKMLSDSFSKLEHGQDEILDLLARNSDTLKQIGDSIDKGFSEADRKSQDRMQLILEKLQALDLKMTPAEAQAKPPALVLVAVALTLGNVHQNEAMQFLAAGDNDKAAQLLQEGRALLEQALQQEPDNADLLASLGYIEKSQAQVSSAKGNADAASIFVDQSAKYFLRALQRDPNNVSAINGMANVYALTHDYDRAIKLGRSLFERRPDYTFAVFDLSLAVEAKLKEPGSDPALVDLLRSLYEHLIKAMPQEPGFPPNYLPYVQERLAALQGSPAKAAKAGGK